MPDKVRRRGFRVTEDVTAIDPAAFGYRELFGPGERGR
jgi:hypothetical protein